MPQGGEHEAGHGDAQNHQQHDGHVRQPVAVQGGQRPPEHPAEAGEGDGQNAQGGGHREVLADDVVHPSVLLGVGDAEVPLKQVAHVDAVLRQQGLVQAVLGLQVGADALRHGLVVGQGVAGHAVHAEEGGRGDEEDREDPLRQAFQGVAQHPSEASAQTDGAADVGLKLQSFVQFSCVWERRNAALGVRRDVGVAVVGVRAHHAPQNALHPGMGDVGDAALVVGDDDHVLMDDALHFGEGRHARLGVQCVLGDAHLLVVGRVAVAAAVVEVPGGEQVAEGEGVVVVRPPTGHHDVEVPGGHLRQPLLEDLPVDLDVQPQVLFEHGLKVFALHVGHGVVPGQQHQGRNFIHPQLRLGQRQMPAGGLNVHVVDRGRVLVPELAPFAVQKNGEQRSAGQVAGQLDDLVNQFVRVLSQMERLAQVQVARRAALPVVELQKEQGAVHEAVDLPALLQGVGQVFRGQGSQDDLLVLEQVEAGVRVGGDVADVDALQVNALLVPVVGVAAHVQGLPMHPVGDEERPVVEHLVRVGAVAALGGLVEVLAHRQVGGEGGELVEEGDGPLEIHLQGAVVQGANAQRLARQQPLVDGFGVFHRIEDEGVFGGVVRVQHQAPGEHEVLGGDGLAVAPFSVLPQMKDRALFVDAPAFRHAGGQLVVFVVAQQALHDVAKHHAAHLVGGAGAVQLRRLVAQQHGDGVVGGIDSAVRAAAGGGRQAGQQVQPPHQRRKPNHRGKPEQPKLPHR